MGESNLEHLFSMMQRRVESFFTNLLFQKILQAALRRIDRSVVGDLKPRIEESVKPKPSYNVLFAKAECLENLAIRFKDNLGSLRSFLFTLLLAFQFTA